MRISRRIIRAFHTMSEAVPTNVSPIPPINSLNSVSGTVLSSTPNSNYGKKLYEGVFAVKKPLHLSSAQVVRDLQAELNTSRLFTPWIEQEREKIEAQPFSQQKRARRRRGKGMRDVKVKIGHGGTLDPLATGVLIIGVGRGTKRLTDFLACTKDYRAALLFGAATDTYDRGGKVLARASHAHIDRPAVEAALPAFRGDIMQTPPIYSALQMDGKRLYEYARKGKELPREIQPRPTRVDRLEITGWLAPGEHNHSFPEEVAPVEERTFADKVLHLTEATPDQKQLNETDTASPSAEATESGLKRKREDGTEKEEQDTVDVSAPAVKRVKDEDATLPSEEDANASTKAQETAGLEAEADSSEKKLALPNEESSELKPPAVELDMTVTSGFYVRSLCHDIGKAMGSLGMMASLIRTRQGDFALDKGNVLDYEDLAKGEEVWGPKLQSMLEDWEARQEQVSDKSNPSNSGKGKRDD